MNIVDEIVNFFSRIFRMKINSVKSQAKSKVTNAQYRAQSKVTNSINNKINAGVKGATDKVKGKAQPQGEIPPKK